MPESANDKSTASTDSSETPSTGAVPARTESTLDLAEIPVFILCGGLGTRLRSVEKGPKATAPVAGLPFLTYTLRLLARQGFRRVFLLAGFKADELAGELGLQSGETAVATGAPEPVPPPGRTTVPVPVPTLTRELMQTLDVRILPEDEPMGTGGAVWQAKDYASDLNLILNGDSYVEIRFTDLLEGVVEEVSQILGVWKHRCAAYGTLELGPENQVVRFVEKGHSGAGWINGGVYAVPRSFFDRLPVGPGSLETDVLPAEAAAGRLAARCFHCFFRDIGTPDRFRQAQAEFAVVRRRIRDEREAADEFRPEVR